MTIVDLLVGSPRPAQRWGVLLDARREGISMRRCFEVAAELAGDAIPGARPPGTQPPIVGPPPGRLRDGSVLDLLAAEQDRVSEWRHLVERHSAAPTVGERQEVAASIIREIEQARFFEDHRIRPQKPKRAPSQKTARETITRKPAQGEQLEVG